MNYRFNRHEKLKSKTVINTLFTEGKSVTVYPLRLVYIAHEFKESSLKAKAGVSVSKRHFKHAVDRNRIKRLLREAYRLQKPELFNTITTPHAFMFLYLGKDMPDFKLVEAKMKLLIKAFLKTQQPQV